MACSLHRTTRKHLKQYFLILKRDVIQSAESLAEADRRTRWVVECVKKETVKRVLHCDESEDKDANDRPLLRQNPNYNQYAGGGRQSNKLTRSVVRQNLAVLKVCYQIWVNQSYVKADGDQTVTSKLQRKTREKKCRKEKVNE